MSRTRKARFGESSIISVVDIPARIFWTSRNICGACSSCSAGRSPHSWKVPGTAVSALSVSAHFPSLRIYARLSLALPYAFSMCAVGNRFLMVVKRMGEGAYRKMCV